MSQIALYVYVSGMEVKKVDFSGIKAGKDATSTVVDQLHEAFSTIGFVTIVNHGVEEKVCEQDASIDRVKSASCSISIIFSISIKL